jgi:replicative DNA helicase
MDNITLPTSVDTEKSILGGILLDDKAYDEAAAAGLEAADFSLESHRRIYQHMGTLASASRPIDLITLIEELSTHKDLEPVGGFGYVTGLIEGVPDRPSIKHYIRIVKEKSAQRKLIHACNATVGGIQDQMSSADGMEYLTDQMLQIQTGSDEAPAKRLMEFSERTYAEWLEIANRDTDLIGLSTGVDSLDMATTGIRETELWLIGGRTGDGKTNLALQTIAANCRRDIPVGMFSIEMPKEAILHRLWAGEGQVDFNHIRFPRRLDGEVKLRIERAMVDVAKWPLHVVEESGIQLSKLVAKAKLMIRRENVKLLVVDYMQQVTTSGKDERERITKVSKVLMGLAKETGVPVLALSQLARPRDGNENFRPTKFNLKESGSLENDAHVVILIYRPVDERKMKTNEDELIIEKQRNGLPSIEKVTFRPWLRFHEREAHWAESQ